MLILWLYVKLAFFRVFAFLDCAEGPVFCAALRKGDIWQMALCIIGRVAQCILKYVKSWQCSLSFQGDFENQIEQNGFLVRSVSLLRQLFSYFDVGCWLSLSLCLPCWVLESVLLELGLGLLPSGGELFPWRILMPHLHLGIVKGNRSPALQSNKPILWGEIFSSPCGL